ncbi:flavonol synthase/flavanone 3-hydroxylase [Medicago truncatula]|uniref:Flavonol synthase/flavanone 3-hydroxylase n=1 Tax=Medicago truncatula TaxID=3880 RepID=G7J6V5_MEDTR|nr:flavonol synthase/flavanone 3-hydroxylase [Medicago truncatula]
MASAPFISSSEPTKVDASNISSIKAFPIPSSYHSLAEPDDIVDVTEELAASIPVIDFSLLTSDDLKIHTKAVHEIAKACSEWGFFMLTNHGVPESLMQELMKKTHEFYNLPEEEKEEFGDDGDPLSPIRHGTSFHPPAESFNYWRDYLKLLTSPQFSFPHKPPGYREVAFEYNKKINGVARKLLQGISESLGLESDSIIDSSDSDSGLHIMGVNFYPPCPQPHLALGLPPHSDFGFLTFLIQNGIGGLQVKHEDKWLNVNPLPNCLVVNIGDQLEAVSNGRYGSVLHRAILNNKDTRISLVVVNGPARDKEIGPAPELLEKEKPLFKSIKYCDYLLVQQKSQLSDGRTLDQIRYSSQ